MTVPYGGERGPTFGDAVFLVFCNRFVAVLFALGMVVAKGETIVNTAPLSMPWLDKIP